jgi:hypothetical protein
MTTTRSFWMHPRSLDIGIAVVSRSVLVVPASRRRESIEPRRIVDEDLVADRRIGRPVRQLVDLCTVLARMRWSDILPGLAAAAMRPVRAPRVCWDSPGFYHGGDPMDMEAKL